MTIRSVVAGSAVMTALVATVFASGWPPSPKASASLAVARESGSALAQRAAAQTNPESFRLEFVGPVGPNVFSRVVVVHTGRVKTIYLSGIAAGGADLTAAATTAFENIAYRGIAW